MDVGINMLFAAIWILLVNASLSKSDLSPFRHPVDLLVEEPKDISAACLTQITSLDPQTTLAMIDASSKIPSGVLVGNFFDLGNFEECLSINSVSNEDPSVPIRGKYCLGTVPFPTKIFNSEAMNRTRLRRIPNKLLLHPQPRFLGTDPDGMGLHPAFCVPHGCSVSDISSELIKFKEEFCYSNDPKGINYGAGFWATIGVVGIFISCVILSTAYDIIREKRGHKPPHQIFLAFSALSNGRKLLSSTNNPDQLLCLNGIKAISMMWVILGHTYSSAIMAPLANFNEIGKFEAAVENMFVMSGTLSVDTFFVVAGLVVVYTFLKSQDKKGAEFNIGLFYLHRYLRLTPALVVVLLYHLYVLKYMGNGPIWGNVEATHVKPCQSGWWATILYLENYQQDYVCIKVFGCVHGLKLSYIGCVAQTWYLSVDTQLYFLSPLVLLPLARWPRFTLYGMFCLSIVGMIIPFTVGYVHDLDSFFGVNSQDYMNLYYDQTYARFAPYVIGMILGYYIYEFKKSGDKAKLTWVGTCFWWMIGLGGLLACVYVPHEADKTRLSNAFMLGFQRPAWALALSIIIYLCVTRNGGPVDQFLSLPIFQFLTKLSYCMYLTHYSIIAVKYTSMKTTFVFSNIEMMMQFWGFFMVSLVVSVLLCLTFESPFIIIERLLLGQGNKSATVKKSPV